MDVKGADTCTYVPTYVHTLLHTPSLTETMSTPSALILHTFTRSINTTTPSQTPSSSHSHAHIHAITLTFLTEPNCSSRTKEVSQFQEVLSQDQQEEEGEERRRGGEERGGEGRGGEWRREELATYVCTYDVNARSCTGTYVRTQGTNVQVHFRFLRYQRPFVITQKQTVSGNGTNTAYVVPACLPNTPHPPHSQAPWSLPSPASQVASCGCCL